MSEQARDLPAKHRHEETNHSRLWEQINNLRERVTRVEVIGGTIVSLQGAILVKLFAG